LACTFGGVLDFDEVLDTSGLVCPEPLMLVRNAVRKLAANAVLRITATDPTTERDFQHFCQFMGHTLENSESDIGDNGQVVFSYWIRKKAA
jgi:tRNA 2-thiouridine synthesizing protein A